MAREARASRTPETLDWELVYKRNPVERLKRDKSPLGILGELPALIAAGYESVAEEDLVRLKWWGLYHDKPKVGTFMLRIKLPGGRVTPAQLRAIGEVSNRFGRGEGELSTRQNVQLHYLELAALPEVFARARGRRPHDRGRLRRRRPQHHRLPAHRPRPRRALRRDAGARGGGGLLLRQPRLLGPAAQAQDHDLGVRAPLQRARDQLHRARRRPARRRARLRRHRRRRPLLGAAARARPRRLRAARRGAARAPRAPRRLEGRPPLPRLARQVADEVHGRRLRRRGDARRARAPARLALPDFTLDPPGPLADHLGVQRQTQTACSAIGVPVHLGLVSGDQMVGVADLAESPRRRRRSHAPAELRRHRRAGGAASTSTVAALAELGFPLDGNSIRGASIACTGEPHCNFSVTETKTRLGSLIEELETRFGDGDRRPAPPPRRLPARVRAALGRRPRLPGHDRPRRARASAARRTTSSCAAASARTRRSRGPCSAACRPRSSTRAVEGSSAAGSRSAARTSRSARSATGSIGRRAGDPGRRASPPEHERRQHELSS